MGYTIQDFTPRILALAEEAAFRGLRFVATVVKQEIQARTPQESAADPRRKPGSGRRSYHYELERQPLQAWVTNRSRTYWLKYVEQGTHKMGARPHFVAGGEAVRRRAEDLMAEEQKKAVR